MSQVSVSEVSRNLSHWINRASYGREVVVVTSRGRAKAVIVGIEAFEEMLGLSEYTEQDLLPLAEFRRAFRHALAESGYHSREDLVELVRDVKQEIVAEGNSDKQDDKSAPE